MVSQVGSSNPVNQSLGKKMESEMRIPLSYFDMGHRHLDCWAKSPTMRFFILIWFGFVCMFVCLTYFSMLSVVFFIHWSKKKNNDF